MTTVDDLIKDLRAADDTIAAAKTSSNQLRAALNALRKSTSIDTNEKQRIGQALNRTRTTKKPQQAPKPSK